MDVLISHHLSAAHILDYYDAAQNYALKRFTHLAFECRA